MRSLETAKRWSKIFLGAVVTAIGLILMPLPGPGGTPVTIAGLAILSTEFAWAKRFLDRLKNLVSSDHVIRRNKWVRTGVIAGSLCFYALSSFILFRVMKG